MNKKSISLYSFGSGVDSLSSMGWTSGINLEKDLENDYFLINSQVRENLKKFDIPEKYEAAKRLPKLRVKLLIALFLSILHVMKKMTCKKNFLHDIKNVYMS